MTTNTLNTFYSHDFFTIKNKSCQSLSILYSFMLGIFCLLLSIIFFFAFNWQEMTDLVKLASLQIMLILSVVIALYFNASSLISKLFFTSASVLVGVFLASFGQIYQTGADSYLLFLAWSVAIFLFVLYSSFAPLWIIFLLIVNICIYLAWNTFFEYIDNSFQYIMSIIAFLNLLFLVIREYCIKKYEWLNFFYTRLIPYILMQSALAFSVLEGIFQEFTLYSIASFILHILLFFVYRYILKDIILCSINLLTFACILLAFPLSRLEFSIDYFIFLSLYALLILGATGKYLVILYKEIGQVKSKNKEVLEIKKTELENIQAKESIQEKNKAKSSYFTAVICAISAIFTSTILQMLCYFIFFEFIENSIFLQILAFICIAISITLYRGKSVYNVDNSYLMLYKASTLLLLAYALLTAEFIFIQETAIQYTALIFTFISIFVTLLIKHSFSIYLINVYSFCLLFFAFSYFFVETLLLNIALFTLLQLGYLYEEKYKKLKLFADISYMVITANTLILLIGRDHFYLDVEMPFISPILALWSCINYILYTRKVKNYWQKVTLLNIVVHLCALLCIGLFVYFNAYPLLYIIAFMVFSLYSDKKSILKKTLVFSIPLLFYYYYNLDITLMNKSLILFVSACILILFAFYNKRFLKVDSFKEESEYA